MLRMPRKPYVFRDENQNGVPSYYNQVPATKSSGAAKAKDKEPIVKAKDKKSDAKSKTRGKPEAKVKSKGFKECNL
jgi:hypothetical protein